MSDTLNQTNVTAPTTTADDPKKTPDGSCCTIPPGGGGDPGPGARSDLSLPPAASDRAAPRSRPSVRTASNLPGMPRCGKLL